MIAGRPSGRVPLPAAVREIAGAHRVKLAWRNELEGLTFEIVDAPNRQFVKWAPAGSGLDLEPEVARLGWLADRWPAPHVVGSGTDAAGSWIVTTAVPGENAVSPRWRARPDVAVRAIGEGLRALHDTLPVAECPFWWSAEASLREVHARVEAGLTDPADWHEEHQSLSLDDALARLETPPPVDRLVVCHGDPCAPNTLIDADGRWSGHVDFGSLGAADRWADVAVATWSAVWNYGAGWDEELLAAYGIEPDEERTAYYRLLWDLC